MAETFTLESAMFQFEEVHEFTSTVLGEGMHAKRLKSLSNATLGVLSSGSLGITAIGHGLAAARSLNKKHAVKQVDRLISNKGLNIVYLEPKWVSYVVGNRSELVVNLDWTDFDNVDQTTLVLALQTGRGRSIPLMWKTAQKSKLKNRMNDIEDTMLEAFREFIQTDIKVIVVADRGFCDTALYDHLMNIGFDFIIRFRSNIIVESAKGDRRKARDWVGKGGRSRVLRKAKVTGKEFVVPTVVLAHDKNMKSGWYLASSLKDVGATRLKKLYGKRFSIEETFRDLKDMRYGMGLSWTRIRSPERRDRLFLLAVLAHALFTLLGKACETLGMDRMLKVNTSKRRQHSLFRQGLDIYDMIPKMAEHKLRPLLETFGQIIESTLLYGHIHAIAIAEE